MISLVLFQDQESTTTNNTNNTDNWMWEWSSRPDQQPPKYVDFLKCTIENNLII